jgi:bacteriocin-like protein
MKKVNLKGQLSLKKETMTKFELNKVNGGGTFACTPNSGISGCFDGTLRCNGQTMFSCNANN